ncbi:MAG: hypothetical protein K6F06_10615 [Bacteroidales bacterium]|nr:hypothetical protein [Bacteroidales bacterium]
MNENTPEIDFLLKAVAEKFGGSVSSTKDFESLSSKIEEETGQIVSTSTLKRLYGYMSLKPQPRVTTLDILSKFIGRSGFRELCVELQDSSAFLSVETVASESLEPGQELAISWLPDREVRLRHIMGQDFEVLDSGSSKLRPGDKFSVKEFMKGQPLYISGIIRDGDILPEYVAGRTAGITDIKVY